MKTNVGSYDAAARFVLGCVLLEVGAHFHTAWGLLGLVPLLTACVAFCPLYLPFHLDTSSWDEPRGHHGRHHPGNA